MLYLHLSVACLIVPFHRPMVASMRVLGRRHGRGIVDGTLDRLWQGWENGTSGGGLEGGALEEERGLSEEAVGGGEGAGGAECWEEGFGRHWSAIAGVVRGVERCVYG